MNANATTQRSTLLLFLVLLVLPARAQTDITTEGIYVANQGNFSSNNGSVTLYVPETEHTQQVAEQLGTIIQSIMMHDERLYVMSSTAGNIDVLDVTTNARIAQISDVVNPRYMAVVSDEKAYVTGQHYDFSSPDDSSLVQIIDLSTNTVSGTIEVPRQPDDVVVVGDSAYVALGTSGAPSRLGVIATESDELARFIDLDCTAPRYLVVDDDEEIHVICSGATDWETGAVTSPGGIVTVNAPTGSVVSNVVTEGATLGTGGTGQDAYYAASLNAVFVIAGSSILQMDAAAHAFTDTLEIAGDDVINAVAYDTGTERLYLGRHDGTFSTLGQVTAHLLDGTEVDVFQAGIAPVHMVFDQTTATSSPQTASRPERIRFEANFPNPFARTTTVPFTLEHTGHVTVEVYDLLGEVVAVLQNGVLAAGYHTVRWDASGSPSGTYVARLATDGRASTQRLVLVR